MRIRTRLTVIAMVAIVASGLANGQSSASRNEANRTEGRPAESRAEKELFAAVNEARRNQGREPLRWNDSLAAAARLHAAAMAEHGSAQHGFEGEPSLSVRVKQAGAHFVWLSENVTQGPKAEFIHAQFMRSPNHRVNILDPDMNSIGVGVVEIDGQMFAVEDFADLR
ncbi:MAG: CAP domain-containing protein [Terriglobales bacterium]